MNTTITSTQPHSPSPECVPADLVAGEDGLMRPLWASKDPLLREYYDQEWGVPVKDERGLYERICLEGFQSGLSWITILRKRPEFHRAFKNFEVDLVAQYTDSTVEELLKNAGIIRHKGKIRAAITNARATQSLRESGGLSQLVWSFKPAHTIMPQTLAEVPTRSVESEALSRTLKKHGFAFVGPTTMFALMEAVGIVDTHLLGSHRRGISGEFSDSGEAI